MNMNLELTSASNFLVHLIRLSRRNHNDNQLEKFRQALVEVLKRRYRDHWFPEKPFKGSGYRCIRINGRMDPVIAQAAECCQLSPASLHQTFPSELTMWIDPKEVSYRIGENGSICVLYEYKDGVTEPWKPQQQQLHHHHHHLNNSNNNNDINNKTKQNQQQQQQQQQQPEKVTMTTMNTSSTPCKESLRNMDYLLDPRKSVSIEQLAAYVSS